MAKRSAVPVGKQRVRVADGVYLKASAKYLAPYRDPGRKQHWKEFDTQAKAVRWRAKCIVDPDTVLFGKRLLVEVWQELLVHLGDNLESTTRANWQQEWRAHIGPALGSWPVGKITIPVVKSFLAKLERIGAGVATRQKCRTILGRVLAEAVENREIAYNPVAVRGTRVKSAQRKKARILQPRDVALVIKAAEEISSKSERRLAPTDVRGNSRTTAPNGGFIRPPIRPASAWAALQAEPRFPRARSVDRPAGGRASTICSTRVLVETVLMGGRQQNMPADLPC